MQTSFPGPTQPLKRSTPDTVPMAPEGPPVAGEVRSQYLVCGGRRRRFTLYLPKGHHRHPVPLLLNLHGSTSYPEEQMRLSGMDGLADRYGLAVLAPEALGRSWNVPAKPGAPDDVTFVDATVDAAAACAPIDSTRCFATGFSGGGRMLAPLVAQMRNRLLAIAPVSGVRYPVDCPNDRKPLVLAFHGALDKVNPYQGGGLDYWKTGVDAAIGAWARHNRATDEHVQHPTPQVTRTIHGTGPARVELYRIANLGHIWPGFPWPLGAQFDPPSTAVIASEVMLDAFATMQPHSAPGLRST